MLASVPVNTRARRGAAVAGESARKKLEKAAIAGEKYEAKLAEEERWPDATTTLGGLVQSAGEWHVAKFLPCIEMQKRAREAGSAIVELDDEEDDDGPPFKLVRLKLHGIWDATVIADPVDAGALVDDEDGVALDPMQALITAVGHVEAGERDPDDGPRADGSALVLDDAVVHEK